MKRSKSMEERLELVEATISELEDCHDLPGMEDSLRKLQLVSLESLRILSNMLKDIDKRVSKIEKNLESR